MESYYNLTEVQKDNHNYFKFFLNLIDNEKYIDNIFNLPKLPLIGIKNEKEKNKNSHLLGKLLSLISFQINICQGEDKDQIEQVFSDFALPKNINEYLNIEEVIQIDNNTDEPDVNLYFMPKKKLNFYFIISELPFYFENNNTYNNKKKNSNNNNNNKLLDYTNEYKYEDDEINFFSEDKNNSNNLNLINNDKDNLNKINIINNDINNINDKNDINYDINNNYKDTDYYYNKFDNVNYNYNEEVINDNDNDNDNSYSIYNLIPHFFYINDKEDDLLEIKSLFFNKQITLFSLPYKKYYDIDKENNDKNFIDINNLRAETSNIFLINKNNFKIEPDNLKFYLNIENDLSQFYLIYTSDEEDHHSVFYYITCNNIETKNIMENILNKSKTLKEVINEIEKIFGKNDIICNLKKVFFNK